MATAAIVGATLLADRSIRALADLSLRATAADIATAAEEAARAPAPPAGDLGRVFADRVVAYALVADAAGRVLYHTNPARLGAALPPSGRGETGAEHGRRTELGTGRPGYELTRAIVAEDGSRRLLRVVIYTAGADRVMRRGRTLWASVAGVLALLWVAGALLLRQAARTERLERQVRRQEALALVGQMTATLAHEIRNAVGGIKGHAQWLEEKTGADDPRKAGLGAVVAGAVRIEALVGELLLFSREERYDLRAVDAGEALASAAEAAAEGGWAGRLTVRPAPALAVRADPVKLGRALANAVRNAVEAAGAGGAVTLSATAAGRTVVFRVEDDGPGLPADALGRAFEPFYTTRESGTGLGLAYAKKVAEGMGGDVALANRPGGRGAAFTLTLPRG